MNKKEAAEALGVSERAVERYTKQGRLSVHYEKGKTRPVAVYDAGEIEHLRGELQSPATVRPRVEPQNSTALMPTNPEQALSPFVGVQFFEGLAALARDTKSQPRADVGSKIMLTLADAAALSSLSENYLREAVRAGKLKGKIIGRGYKIKRTDLDSFVKKL
jgi:excisionase family DNA binding protein